MDKTLIDLAKNIVKNKIPTNFSGTVDDMENTLREEIRALACDYNAYRKNKYDIFELIQASIDEVLPNRVIDIFGMFADVQHFAEGQKPVFKRRLGKSRAKQFVTQVGLAGTYETFRLDSEDFTIGMKAYGGAVAIDFERYLDGLENLAELYDIVVERLAEIIFEEIQKCLLASWDNTGRPAANQVSVSEFDSEAMVKLCNTVSAYGAPVILCSPQFAAEMTNAIDYAKNTPNLPLSDLEDIREYGYIGRHKGTPVVVLPQSFTDDTNTQFVVNPKVAYVLPAGREKIVAIAMEGNTIVDEFKNKGDRSMEIQTYTKFGVAIKTPLNYWGIYENTGIEATGWENLSD